MAIIKCPECGHDVSDKAPVCLYCGVEIAGKYIARPVPTPRPVSRPTTATTQNPAPVATPQQRPVQAQPQAPVQNTASQATSQARPVQPQASQARPAQPQARPAQAVNRPQQGTPKPQPSIYDNGGGQIPSGSKPKKSHALIYLILLLILIIGGVVLYNAFTNKEADTNKEESAFKFAMQSEDPKSLQAYLDEYSSAPRAHRDSIQSRLTKYNKLQREWDNVYTSNSRSAFEKYAKEHPDSKYRNVALHKVDSIDWARAKNEDSTEAYDAYLAEHPDGEHTAEARRLSTNPTAEVPADTQVAATATENATPAATNLTVSPDEKTRVDNATTYFFQAINSRDAAKIGQKVPQPMTRFLNTTNATAADVVAFSQKLLEGGVTNYNWRIDHNSYTVNKNDLGNGNFEYTTDFKATLSKNTPSGNQQQTYVVSAKVQAGRVVSLTMKKNEAAAQ